MLELRSVSKAYSGSAVLNDVSLTFPPSKVRALIGRSGCGKSTILRLLIGLESPDSGSVLFDGQPLPELDLMLVRRRLGYVIQEGGLFPHLTARENITLVAKYLRRPENESNKRVEELSALTDFPPDGLDRFPAQLSGGQRQRVSLMRALFLDPDVLLLDEPLGALDPMIRSELQNQLKLLFRRLNKTVVIVTHDLGEAAFLADEIVLINEGKVIQQGSLKDLMTQPADPFVSDFVQAQRHPTERDLHLESEG